MLVIALLSLLASPAPCVVVRAPVASAASAVPAIPALPSYLSVPDPASRVQITNILAAAQGSPTAQNVLSRVEATVKAHGRPVIIEVGNSKAALGTYSLDTGVVTLNLQDIGGNPNANVATTMHELVHFMQQDIRLPSDLLETELEAYVTDFRISRELGYKPPADGFNAVAQKELKKGFEPFMKMLHAQYPGNAFLWRTHTHDYQARLRSIIKKSTADLALERAERAKKKAVLEQMRDLGQPKSEIKAYRQDNLPKIDARIVKFRRLIQWARKDLAILSDTAALREARAYARAVVRRAREFQKEFARN